MLSWLYIAISHWCIFHRSKAEVVVTTWEKQFRSAEVAQKVPLLYVANDILQNSKRKGNEFVSEFWKVLPGALKDLIEKGNDHGKNVVTRLVCILKLLHVLVFVYTYVIANMVFLKKKKNNVYLNGRLIYGKKGECLDPKQITLKLCCLEKNHLNRWSSQRNVLVLWKLLREIHVL